MTAAPSSSFGSLLRAWRQRRRLSQLDLAGETEISTRHLSFMETGRATPSRDMVLRLAGRLDVPLRGRNELLMAAGYAPVYPARSLNAPDLHAARQAVELVLRGHGPYPALAVDRHWTLVQANVPLTRLVSGVAPELLEPPVNVLRLSLHPGGLAPHIQNLVEWRGHLLSRLAGQIERTGDPALAELLNELKGYEAPPQQGEDPHGEDVGVALPLRLRTERGVLSLISTTTVFGTPTEVTLSELAIEAFFPADAVAAALLHALAGEA